MTPPQSYSPRHGIPVTATSGNPELPRTAGRGGWQGVLRDVRLSQVRDTVPILAIWDALCPLWDARKQLQVRESTSHSHQ